MSRFGKKLVMVGIWAGVGILLGMQFSGSGGQLSLSCCQAGLIYRLRQPAK